MRELDSVQVTLTLKGVKEAALKAYHDKRLTAQAPDIEDRRCVYFRLCKDGISRFCAVGAAIPPDVAKAYVHKGGVVPIATNDEGKPLFFIEQPEEELKIREIQKAHDEWTALSRESERKREISEKEKEFLSLIS